jgi:hypothetical protein
LIDQPGSREQAESVIWVDPSKGFVPVSTRFGAAGKEPASHTEFTDFADLGSGRFYSRTWRQTWTPIPSGPQTTEYHLQILPEAPATHWMEHPVYVP